MTGSKMFYTREWSILRMFYMWDFMHKEISVTSKMYYFIVPPYYPYDLEDKKNLSHKKFQI